MATRILHIIPTLDRGGAEKQLCLLAAGLPRDEFEVHVAALTRGGPRLAELLANQLPTTVIGKRWKIDPLALSRLARHIQRLQPELIHTWLFAAAAYGRVAARYAGVKRVIVGERCVDRWKPAWAWALDRKLAGKTNQFVTNNPAVRDYCAKFGLPAGKFTIIANGVAAVSQSRVSRSQLLQELQLPEDARLIGVIGRLWPQKRVTDLIWAADLLRVLHDNMRLLVIGDGPQRPQLERFARLASDLDHIRFLGQRSDVERIFPHLDVLWQGSAYEGQANTVLEAMAAGVPVIASDIPGHSELVVPGETGYLVPIAARAARVQHTDRIFGDAELSQRMGLAAQKRVQENFSVQRMIDGHVDLYRRVLE
jgi:glycosyltransferase involved in cell wall biosynthesis